MSNTTPESRVLLVESTTSTLAPPSSSVSKEDNITRPNSTTNTPLTATEEIIPSTPLTMGESTITFLDTTPGGSSVNRPALEIIPDVSSIRYASPTGSRQQTSIVLVANTDMEEERQVAIDQTIAKVKARMNVHNLKDALQRDYRKAMEPLEEGEPTPLDDQPIVLHEPKLADATIPLSDRRYYVTKKDPPPDGDYVCDVLYQHERGAFFFGIAKFSSKSLLPMDPDPWTNSKFQGSHMDITNTEVPDPTWEWVYKTWLVDMVGDVDEDGWQYAATFHGSPWHGSYEPFRSFARRRRWIRLRRKKDRATLEAEAEATYEAEYGESKPITTRASPYRQMLWPENEKNGEEKSKDGHKLIIPTTVEELAFVVKKSISDRDRLASVSKFMANYPGQVRELGDENERFLRLLDYEISRVQYLKLVAVAGNESDMRKAAEQLVYFSDQKVVIQTVPTQAKVKT